MGYWTTLTYVAGQVEEKVKYYMHGDRPKSKRRILSDLRKQAQNKKGCERELARIINANFAAGDVFIGLDYSNDYIDSVTGASDEETVDLAEREMRLCLRRVKNAADKLGVEVKCVAVTSVLDGESGERVRVHHHLVVNRECAEIFKAKWKRGGVDFESLKTEQDYSSLAHYLIAQVLHTPDKKKYYSTRNLVRVQPKARVAMDGREISVPRGCVLLHRSEYGRGISQYIRYYRPKKEEDGKGNNPSVSGDDSSAIPPPSSMVHLPFAE